MKDVNEASGRRFIYWLSLTLCEERERANIPVTLIASVLGEDANVARVLRFEKGEAYGRDIDLMVAAYAYALGKDDARDLWGLALSRWRERGAAPDFTADMPGARFLRPIREEAQRRRQARAEPSEKRSARKNRREAG